MIHALVLTAGESRRMGMPKPLLRFSPQGTSCVLARPGEPNGDPNRDASRLGTQARPTQCGETTFLEHITSVLRSSSVDAITVVLGARADAVRASTDLAGTNVVINENYHQGQLSSLIAGLKSVPPQTDAIVLCLVDNPLISTDVVNRLIDGFGKTGKPIVLPVFEGRRGHPALFARSLFDELLNAPADKGARHVVSSNQDKILEVDVPDRGVLMSIDTPEDYRSCFGAEPQVVLKMP